jgi:hypothetical protein
MTRRRHYARATSYNAVSQWTSDTRARRTSRQNPHFIQKGIRMRKVIFVAVMGFGLSSMASAQDAPAPCGPAGDLSADLSTNVATDSRCFELRMYTADVDRDGVDDYKGGINELHQRFREKEVEIFENHGAEVIAVWQNLDAPNTLIWMLAYRDRAHRQEVWAAFAADPEWSALLEKYNVPITRPDVFMMSATDYSALK